MVNAKKHEAETKSNPLELSDEQLQRISMFYSCDTLSDDIIEYATSKYEKEFDGLDVMNVAVFTLHGIISAETDAEKSAVKDKLCGMIDDKYNLNEWLFTVAHEVKARDKTIAECIKSGNVDNIDAEIDKAVKEANYIAWKDELRVIKRNLSAKDRINEIRNGGVC